MSNLYRHDFEVVPLTDTERHDNKLRRIDKDAVFARMAGFLCGLEGDSTYRDLVSPILDEAARVEPIVRYIREVGK